MDFHDAASVRNLEQIQEEAPRSAPTFGTMAIVVLSGACVLLGTLAFGARRTVTPDGRRADPLGELAAARSAPSTLQPGEVTFPNILSDRPNPATALAAPTTTVATTGTTAIAPPPAGDRLPVVPLPARHALGVATASAPSAVVPARGKDRLSVLADTAMDATTSGGSVGAAGSEGGYQLQVSSFRTRDEAEAFSTQLRARGHKAHVERADIPSRGTWYRVRIGPFGTQGEANRYRSTFEAKEHVPAFVMKSGVERY